MKHNNLPKTDEEMARNIANLKGKDLEDYIRDSYEVLGIINNRLKEGNHSEKVTRAYKETKRTIEELLEVIEPNHSN